MTGSAADAAKVVIVMALAKGGEVKERGGHPNLPGAEAGGFEKSVFLRLHFGAHFGFILDPTPHKMRVPREIYRNANFGRPKWVSK